jgi:hypothetical protein
MNWIRALPGQYVRFKTKRRLTFTNRYYILRYLENLPRLDTMKEALVQPDLSVRIVESPIPTPGPDEITIQVVTLGINPIDWKATDPEVASALLGMLKAKQYANPGKDIAGYVHSVGSCFSSPSQTIVCYS